MSAGAGTCDGCKQAVCNGERVMDCRKCNWYLCERCHPQERDISFWDTLTSALDTAAQDMSTIAKGFNKEFETLVNVVTCHAPDKEEMEFAEIDIRRSDQFQNLKVSAQAEDPNTNAPKEVLNTNNNENNDDSQGDQTIMPEKETPPKAAVEENLMEFEQDDLLDLSDVKPAPSTAQGLIDIFEIVPPGQNPTIDPFDAPSSPPLLLEQATVVETTAAPSTTIKSENAKACISMDLLLLDTPPSPSPQPAPQAADLHGQNLIEVY